MEATTPRAPGAIAEPSQSAGPISRRRRLPRWTAIALLTPPFLLAIAIVGFGVPLIWLLIAAKIQGAAGITSMTTETALAVYPGVAISYAFVGYLAARIADRLRADEDGERGRPRTPSYPWLRAMSDEPEQTAPATRIEKVFILAAGSVSVAFTIWFFLWAGSPLPAA